MVTDDTRRAFIAEMRTMPDDDLRRLVYADMLEEDGDDLDRSHAWLIRHMIAQRDHHIVVDNRAENRKVVSCSGRLQFKRCGSFMRRLGRRFGSPPRVLWRRGFPTVVHGSWGWWGTHREELLLHSIKPTVHIADFSPDVIGLMRPLTGVKARRYGDAGWAVDGMPGPLTVEQALARLYPEVGQFHLPSPMEARRFAEMVGYDFSRRMIEAMEAPLHIPPGMFTRLAAFPVIEGSPVNLQLRRVASPVRVTREMLDDPTIDVTRLHAEMVENAAFRRIAESLAVPPWIASTDRASTENPEGPK